MTSIMEGVSKLSCVWFIRVVVWVVVVLAGLASIGFGVYKARRDNKSALVVGSSVAAAASILKNCRTSINNDYHLAFAPYIFSSNMTLPMKPHHITFWGTLSMPPSNFTGKIRVSMEGIDHDDDNGDEISKPVKKSWTTTTMASTTNDNGTWTFTLDESLPVSYDVTVTLSLVFSDQEEMTFQTLNNVVIGKVFLCSGQSNMEMSINGACPKSIEECQETIRDSINYPYLRMFTVHHDNSSIPLDYLRPPSPQDFSKAPPFWVTSHQSNFYTDYPVDATTGDVRFTDGFQYFSATCYFFGRTIYEKFNGTVPIGLISSTWGGTKIQSWSQPTKMYHDCGYQEQPTKRQHQGLVPSLLEQNSNKTSTSLMQISTSSTIRRNSLMRRRRRQQGQEQEQQEEKLLTTTTPSPLLDGSLYNAMIHPLRNVKLSGIVWYQGEANFDEASMYKCLFPSMIHDWRHHIFQNPTLPFSFVQLAPNMPKPEFPSDEHDKKHLQHGDNAVLVDSSNEEEQYHFEEIREAQAMGGLSPMVNHTSMAVALDLGDLFSPLTPIHPRRKQQVGYRLAIGMFRLLMTNDDDRDIIDNSNQKKQQQQVTTGPNLLNYTVIVGEDDDDIIVLLSFEPFSSKGLHMLKTPDCEWMTMPIGQDNTSNTTKNDDDRDHDGVLCCERYSPFYIRTIQEEKANSGGTSSSSTIVVGGPSSFHDENTTTIITRGTLDHEWTWQNVPPQDVYIHQDRSQIKVRLKQHQKKQRQQTPNKEIIFADNNSTVGSTTYPTTANVVMQLGLHWRTAPPCVLYNEQNLPAPPFRLNVSIPATHN